MDIKFWVHFKVMLKDQFCIYTQIAPIVLMGHQTIASRNIEHEIFWNYHRNIIVFTKLKLSLCYSILQSKTSKLCFNLQNFVLLRIVTYTSIKMHHTIVVPFNSNANVHVIVSRYMCFVNVTLSSTWKGDLDLLELFG
jgi:hypothetical protein